MKNQPIEEERFSFRELTSQQPSPKNELKVRREKSTSTSVEESLKRKSEISNNFLASIKDHDEVRRLVREVGMNY